MKELLQSINANAERLYSLTRGKYTMSLEMLEVLQDRIKSMIEDIEEAKKEVYEDEEG